MKVITEVDCTPLEARQLLGLPDVGPLQEKWLAKIEEKMMESVEFFSAEAVARKWLLEAPAGFNSMADAFMALARGAGGGKVADPK